MLIFLLSFLFFFFPGTSITTGLMFINVVAQRFNTIKLRNILGYCIFGILKSVLVFWCRF